MDAILRLFWWLFARSTGASSRFQVLSAVREEPRNAMQLSQALNMDYTTIRHHLEILEKNQLILTEGGRYGKLYFVSDMMDSNWSKLEEVRSNQAIVPPSKSVFIEYRR
jgi:predicted transcriptional regulator